ncbi:MAG: undecaprenyl-diphosphatase [Flavobacteriaceae bacterium]|jgi:undecaprenyl-diphosphatase
MLEAIVLGAIQGVFEWLPVSSEAMLVLAQIHLFGGQNASELIAHALSLHIGTLFAGLVYFRKDIALLWKKVMSDYRQHSIGHVLSHGFSGFIITTTFITLVLGGSIYLLLQRYGGIFQGEHITFAVGIFLLITAFFLHQRKKGGIRENQNLHKKDSLIVGLGQACALLPGISRSGTTVALLLWRKFSAHEALRISFIMGLPVVFLGGIILLSSSTFSLNFLVSIVSAFVFGLATIHLLLKVAEKINFTYFVFGFGVLTVLASFI